MTDPTDQVMDENDNPIDVGYRTIGELETRIAQLKEDLTRTEADLDQTKKTTVESIKEGASSCNRFCDFVFVKLAGQHNLPLKKWLEELDTTVVAHPGQLVLVIADKPYDPGPSGGVIFDSHYSDPVPKGPEPTQRRILKLGVLNGEPLLLDAQTTAYISLSCGGVFIERRSLLTWNDRETNAFAPKKQSGPCQIGFGDRVTGFLVHNFLIGGEIKSRPVEVLPFAIPKVVIGDQAVTRWMLEHYLHDNGGGIPSIFHEMCGMLNRRLND